MTARRPHRHRRRSSSAAARPARPSAYWLAEAGHDVAASSSARRSRGRRPAATGSRPGRCSQLEDMGLADELAAATTATTGCGRSPTAAPSSCSGPSTRSIPRYGYVVRRRDLDQIVAAAGRRRPGATLLAGHRGARARSSSGGLVRGAVVQAQGRRRAPEEIRARYVVVADGANSRFGRALGTGPQPRATRRAWPSAATARRPLHDEPWIESALDVRDRNGNVAARLRLDLPGRRRHGQRRHRPAVDVPRLQGGQHHPPPGRVRAPRARATGGSTPTTSCGPPTGGRLPMGGSVGPKAGPTCLVVGDAAGIDQPVQRRGHRLRLRDRAHGRRRCSTRR